MAHCLWGCVGVLGTMFMGCDPVCSGPACEDDWPATILAIHSGQDIGLNRHVWEDASSLFEGSALAGAQWSISSLGMALFVGWPEADTAAWLGTSEDSFAGGIVQQWEDLGTDFGTSLLATPRLDGVGVDCWVGGPGWESDRGRVSVYHYMDENQTGENTEPAVESGPWLEIVGESNGDRLGNDLHLCGDVTGDGVADVMIGVPWWNPPEDSSWYSDAEEDGTLSLPGAVVLLRSEWLASKSGTIGIQDVGGVWWGASSGSGFGHSVWCEDDLTGNGLSDILIGAPFDGTDRSGRVYFVEGSPALPEQGDISTVSAWDFSSGEASDWFGYAITVLDGSSPDETKVAVGAPGHGEGLGLALVYSLEELFAHTTEPDIYATLSLSAGHTSPDHLGKWLEKGDFDGDGFDDLVIGVPDYQVELAVDVGQLWVINGNTLSQTSGNQAVEAVATAELIGEQPFQRIGKNIHIGDFDEDGLDDLAVPTRTLAPE